MTESLIDLPMWARMLSLIFRTEEINFCTSSGASSNWRCVEHAVLGLLSVTSNPHPTVALSHVGGAGGTLPSTGVPSFAGGAGDGSGTDSIASSAADPALAGVAGGTNGSGDAWPVGDEVVDSSSAATSLSSGPESSGVCP